MIATYCLTRNIYIICYLLFLYLLLFIVSSTQKKQITFFYFIVIQYAKKTKYSSFSCFIHLRTYHSIRIVQVHVYCITVNLKMEIITDYISETSDFEVTNTTVTSEIIFEGANFLTYEDF